MSDPGGGGSSDDPAPTVRLQVGDMAPGFALPDTEGTTRSLTDFTGRRVVLYFYPAAMTPGCTKEACDFRDNLAILNSAGIDVVGISPDQVPRLAQFREKEGLRFPLLSDPDHGVLADYGAWGPRSLYGRNVVGVIRSTFVVGPDGRLEQAQYQVRATGHVARLLRTLDLGTTAD